MISWKELIDCLNMEHNCTNVSVFIFQLIWTTTITAAKPRNTFFCFVAIIIRKIFRVRVIISRLCIKMWVGQLFQNEKMVEKKFKWKKVDFISSDKKASIKFSQFLFGSRIIEITVINLILQRVFFNLLQNC